MKPAQRSPATDHVYDAFISYAHEDAKFAELLLLRLEKYKIQKALLSPPRHFDIILDTADFSTDDYRPHLEKNILQCKKLIVICSSDARSSEYVNEEIRIFGHAEGFNHIIPVLFRGIPNNEARTTADESNQAFPKALFDFMQMPIAIDYRGVDLQKKILHKGTYSKSWYALIADMLGLDRAVVEQRERRRILRRRQITFIILAAVILFLFFRLLPSGSRGRMRLMSVSLLRPHNWMQRLPSCFLNHDA